MPSPDHEVGVAGLAMLAFLHGGSTLRDGPHRDPVKRTAQWLRERQSG